MGRARDISLCCSVRAENNSHRISDTQAGSSLECTQSQPLNGRCDGILNTNENNAIIVHHVLGHQNENGQSFFALVREISFCLFSCSSYVCIYHKR